MHNISTTFSQFRLNLFNATIASNPEQLEAVRRIIEGPSPHAPYVIFGPPGKYSTIFATKTTALLGII